jgi:shikimate dehydrogenase
MVEKAFDFHDLDWRYLTFEVEPANLANAVLGLRALGFRGAHCFDPHKEAIIPLLDRITDTAAIIGVVNLIFREDAAWVGENTEGKGVIESLRETIDLAGKRVVLLGAGRVARAIAVELATAGIAELTVLDRTEETARNLTELLSTKFNIPFSAVDWREEFEIPQETDLLIHATSLGHRTAPAPLALNPAGLRPELLVAEVAVGLPQTWLMSEATQRGCKTIDGLSIFIHQVALGFRLWTGIDPDRQVLREAIEEYWEL